MHEQSSHYTDLLNSVRGLIFFGVPHHGSDVTYWSNFAANLLKIPQLQLSTNSRFVKALKRNSTIFADISQRFIKYGVNIPIRTFYETEKLSNWQLVCRYLMWNSAVLLLTSCRLWIKIPHV